VADTGPKKVKAASHTKGFDDALLRVSPRP
jgi:hypothetical protein